MDINKEYLKELSYISKITGQDERLVQAGGGNTSVKIDDHLMAVKASGYQLTDVTEEQGYSIVDYRNICDTFEAGNYDVSDEASVLASSLIDGKRPSIETFLHSFTGKYTIHSHPLGVTMIAVRDDWDEILKGLFPDAVFVDYSTPGIKLAGLFYDALRQGSSDIVFLKNHGLVVSADTAEDAVNLQQSVIDTVDSYLGLDVKAFDAGYELFKAVNRIDPSAIVYRVESPAVEQAYKKAGGVWDHAYSPDCVVYCGLKIAEIEGDIGKALMDHKERYGDYKVILFNGFFFAVAPNIRKAKDIAGVLEFTARIYMKEDGDSVSTLPVKERELLLGWDSEKYRASL